MDTVQSTTVMWMSLLIVVGCGEWYTGAFAKDPFQTYAFVLAQLPFHALVVYASTCMMTIGYHLLVLGKLINTVLEADANPHLSLL